MGGGPDWGKPFPGKLAAGSSFVHSARDSGAIVTKPTESADPLRERAGDLRRLSPAILLAICASCGLAYAIPFDVIFDRLTFNIPAARALAMLVCWSAGLWLQRVNGFSLGVVKLRKPALTITAAALGVAVWCIVMDGLIFRSSLPPGYHLSEQLPLSTRLLYYCSRAFNENVMYRLFLGSLFAWLLRRWLRDAHYALALSMGGMAAAQFVNVTANLAFAGFAPETSLWLLLRFVLPGVLWAWLYVRHGFAANEAAAMGVHGFLQPMVTVAF